MFGRLRLTLRLARCTLALPCVVDAVMVREAEQEEREREQERQQERERQRLAREATHGRARRRRRPQGVAGATGVGAVEEQGDEAAEENNIPNRGFNSTTGERKKRRPRVRTASTSGPYDDAPFPGADDDDAPDAANGASNAPRRKRGGILHPRVNSMIMSVCGALEYGERMV